MPRKRLHSNDPLFKMRNMHEANGLLAMAGRSRVGLRATKPVTESVTTNPQDAGGGGAPTSNAAHVLVMTASADSIASGGDEVTFSSMPARFGFATTTAAGASWTHPVSGVYMLTYEHVWDTYQGGGSIQLLIDGEVAPGGTIAAGTTGERGRGTIAYYADSDTTGSIRVIQSSGSARTCDATVWVALPDPGPTVAADTIETLWLDSRVGTVTGAVNLEAGLSYNLVVDGVIRIHSESQVDEGIPEAVTYPSSGQGGSSAGELDADVQFASSDPGSWPTHTGALTFDTGSGAAHVEPVGGPYGTPQSGHTYTFQVVGEGVPLTAAFADALLTDNNGQFRIQVTT